MKVLVCGSRRWRSALPIYDAIAALPTDAIVLVGGAKGADRMAESDARDRGLAVERFLPDYGTHGKSAPHIRNDEMLAHSNRVIVFWDGESPGTKSVIQKARKRGIPVEVVGTSGEILGKRNTGTGRVMRVCPPSTGYLRTLPHNREARGHPLKRPAQWAKCPGQPRRRQDRPYAGTSRSWLSVVGIFWGKHA